MATLKKRDAVGTNNLYDLFKKVKRQGNYRRKVKELAEIVVGKNSVSETMNITCESAVNESAEDIEMKTNLDDVCENVLEENWLDFEIEDQTEIPSLSNAVDSTSHNSHFDLTKMQQEFHQKLSEWAHACNPTHHQIRELLMVCNETLPFNLPRDPRTILGTPRSVTITNFADGVGQYWHHGLIENIRRILEQVSDLPPKVSINVNADGLPISESSNAQFWPILCNIHELHHIQPIVIGIFCGTSKILRFSVSLITKSNQFEN